jgi:hypothetical protein
LHLLDEDGVSVVMRETLRCEAPAVRDRLAVA